MSPAPTQRVCTWCKRPIAITKRRDSKFCHQHCRQASHRFAVCRSDVSQVDRPLRFAYADPPYPGKAFMYAEKTEVDHAALIRRLQLEYPDGWALSTSAGALRDIWPLCPEARLCVWVKAPRFVRVKRISSSFEALLVAGGRDRRPAVAGRSTCDVLLEASGEVSLPTSGATCRLLQERTRAVSQDLGDTSLPAGGDVCRSCERHVVSAGPGEALVYRGRHRAFPGAMVGMKPPAFAEWMFRLLGARPGDTLDDLFPGSGAITEAWMRYAGSGAPAMKRIAAEA